MIKKCTMILLALIYSHSVYAEPLLYKDRTVEAFCFSDLFGKGVKSINLDDCNNQQIEKKPSDSPLIKKGFEGYSYTTGQHSQSIFYRQLGQRDGRILIQAMFSGGGSGYFSTISSMKLVDNRLEEITQIAGGDRCNGGIQFATYDEEKKELYWTQNITPYEVIQLRDKQPDLIARRDLDDSAAACVAEVSYINGEMTGINWRPEPGLYVDRQALEKRLKEKEEWERKFRLQTCFNKLRTEETTLGRSVSDVDRFITNFRTTCVPK